MMTRLRRSRSRRARRVSRPEQAATLLADGLSNEAIAARLGIAEHTVRLHLIKAYRAWGIRTDDRGINPRVVLALRLRRDLAGEREEATA